MSFLYYFPTTALFPLTFSRPLAQRDAHLPIYDPSSYTLPTPNWHLCHSSISHPIIPHSACRPLSRVKHNRYLENSPQTQLSKHYLIISLSHHLPLHTPPPSRLETTAFAHLKSTSHPPQILPNPPKTQTYSLRLQNEYTPPLIPKLFLKLFPNLFPHPITSPSYPDMRSDFPLGQSYIVIVSILRLYFPSTFHLSYLHLRPSTSKTASSGERGEVFIDFHCFCLPPIVFAVVL